MISRFVLVSRALLLLAGAVNEIACSSTSSSPAWGEPDVATTVSGTVQGFAMHGLSGVAVDDGTAITIALSTQPIDCGSIPAPGAVELLVTLPGPYGDKPRAVVPGAPSLGQGAANVLGYTSSCGIRAETSAAAGEVRLGSEVVDVTGGGGAVTGSLDLTFPEGHLAGDFQVTLCDAPAVALAPSCAM